MSKRFLFFCFFVFISIFVFANYKFIRIGPSGSYFELNGKAFVPIGFNYGVDWPAFANLWTGNVGGIKWGDPEAVEKTFSEWHSYGVNTLRIFMEDAADPSGSALFENKFGQVNKPLIKVWDYIFEYAKKYDIYLVIEPFDPFWISKNWNESPLNVKNGGPLISLNQFLSNQKIIRDTEFRFKFFIDRWGESSHILAWEINNEIDLWYGKNNSSSINNYIRTISKFITDYEILKFGEHHLITISTAAPVLKAPLANVIYDNKSLDFVTTHLYLPAVNNPTSTVKPAIEVAQAVADNLKKIDCSKPYFDSEDGPINGCSLPSPSIDEYFHNMLWAEFSMGSSSPGLKWPYLSSSYIISVELYKALSDFINSPGIDWLRFKACPAVQNLKIRESKEYVIPFSCGDKNARIVWLLKNTDKDIKNVNFTSLYVTVSDLKNGTYTVELWDTYTGRILDKRDINTHNKEIKLNINLSHRKDVAIKVYRNPES